MKLIIRILKVALLTFLIGVLFYIAKYFIDIPPEPNMYGIGLVISSVIYSILNTIFVSVIYLITYIFDKQMYKRILSLTFLFFEIVFLYVCIVIIYQIPYSLNILSINKVTENDLFYIFTPFIVLSVLWLIVILVIGKKNRIG